MCGGRANVVVVESTSQRVRRARNCSAVCEFECRRRRDSTTDFLCVRTATATAAASASFSFVHRKKKGPRKLPNKKHGKEATPTTPARNVGAPSSTPSHGKQQASLSSSLSSHRLPPPSLARQQSTQMQRWSVSQSNHTRPGLQATRFSRNIQGVALQSSHSSRPAS